MCIPFIWSSDTNGAIKRIISTGWYLQNGLMTMQEPPNVPLTSDSIRGPKRHKTPMGKKKINSVFKKTLQSLKIANFRKLFNFYASGAIYLKLALLFINANEFGSNSRLPHKFRDSEGSETQHHLTDLSGTYLCRVIQNESSVPRWLSQKSVQTLPEKSAQTEKIPYFFRHGYQIKGFCKYY